MNEKDLVAISNILRYEIIKVLIERYKDIELSSLDIIERVADDILLTIDRVGMRNEVKEMIT
jgi:hypothetical protein